MTKMRLLACLAACLLPFAASAQGSYPDRPIRLVVPFAPGGVTDTSGRVIAEALSKRLGQQVIVENKAGASGNIGTQGVAAAPPDGYTLVLGFDGTLVINPHVFPSIPFDTVKDLAPVGKIGDADLIIVAHPSLPAKTLRELIDYSKQDPKGVSYGTSGVGGTPHIAGELLAQQTGAKLVHVPYKGGGQAMADALGGQIPLVFTAVAGAQQHVKSGKLAAIAVSSAKRTSALPDVPTFVESGVPDFVVQLLGRHPRAGEDSAAHRRPAEPRAQRRARHARDERAARQARHRRHARHARRLGAQIRADLRSTARSCKAAGIKAE